MIYIVIHNGAELKQIATEKPQKSMQRNIFIIIFVRMVVFQAKKIVVGFIPLY